MRAHFVEVTSLIEERDGAVERIDFVLFAVTLGAKPERDGVVLDEHLRPDLQGRGFPAGASDGSRARQQPDTPNNAFFF